MVKSQSAFTQHQLYQGQLFHKRFTPVPHQFSYPLCMLALNVDELAQKPLASGVIGSKWFQPIRFVEKDYLKGEPGTLKQRIINKVKHLGGEIADSSQITMLVQARCFGLYFSPANFYFCQNEAGDWQTMLVEVSNTPWNERHYYLVDLSKLQPTEKAFHVSPFMPMQQTYRWQVTPPVANSTCSIAIENRDYNDARVFLAQMNLQGEVLTAKSANRLFLRFPMMTLSVVLRIYWQALKLFLKRVPFVPYTKANTTNPKRS